MADKVGDILTQIIAESKNYVAGLQTATSSLRDWGDAVNNAFSGIEETVKKFSNRMESVFGGVDQTLEIFRFAANESLKAIGTSFKDLKSDTDIAFRGIGKTTKEFTGNTDEVLRSLSRTLKQLAKDAGSPIKGFKALREETDTALKGVAKSTQDFNQNTGAALKELNENLKNFSKVILANLDLVKRKNQEVQVEGTRSFTGLGNSILNFKNLVIAAATAIATSRLIGWLGDLIEKAEEFDAASRGLKAAAQVTNTSFDELTAAAKGVSAGGLISFEAAAKGLKNFVLFGFSVDQARQALIRLIEQSILFGSSRKNLESNVLQSSDAFRLMNDEILKNIGITGGLTGVASRAGVAIEELQNDTTRAAASQQIFSQFMRDTAGAAGLAEQASQGWSGAAGQLTVSLDSLKVKLGEIIEGGLLPFLKVITPLLDKVNAWLAANQQVLSQDLTRWLSGWTDALASFVKDLNPAKVEAFAHRIAEMGAIGRIAFNLLSIPVKVLVGLLQFAIVGAVTLVHTFKEIISGAGTFFSALNAAITGDFRSAFDILDKSLAGVEERHKDFEAQVLAMGDAATATFQSIGTDIDDIAEASDSAKAHAQAATDAMLRSEAAIAEAKEKEIVATKEHLIAQKEHDEYMAIAREKGIEAASEWLATQERQTQATANAVPIVQELTGTLAEQRNEVDALTIAVQRYASALGALNAVSGDNVNPPNPGSMELNSGGSVKIEVETDWPTVTKKVTEQQQQLQLQGYKPGDH